jgi:hypothetical protein
MKKLLLQAFVAVVLVAPAQAQDARTKVREIFHFGSCDALICLSTTTGVHGDHYNPDAAAVGQVVVDFVNNAITNSVSNIPLGATSSGTTFTFDAAGLPVATAQSTGPILGERSQTLGRGRGLISGKFSRSVFSSLRGIPLDQLQLTLTHEDEDPAGLGDPAFERDTIHISTALEASVSVFALSGTWGITNNVDIGIAVPIVNLSVSGQSVGTIVPTTGAVVHFFKGTPTEPQLVDTAASSAQQTGIGDVSLRAKFNLVQSPIGGAAFLTDVRLPTGEKDNLLGTGETSVSNTFIASLTLKQFTPHANIGYMYRSGDDQNSSVLAAIGFDALIAAPFTLAADLVGSWPVGTDKLALPKPVVFQDGTVVQRSNIPRGNDDIVAAGVGVKYLLGAGFTGVANALFPASDGGMRPKMTWTVGIERNF